MDITIAGSDVVSDENREERTAGQISWENEENNRCRPSLGSAENEAPPTIYRD
ncbi:hypothetical protein [Paenibacillus ihbetae]|uniref:hypothetical protein n=1 Tax=Paenibacillus ihbetae TaxID=1870820 RepID=UPI0012FFDF70|nr:hypothetical protein [Paenibacillus ihbetae]